MAKASNSTIVQSIHPIVQSIQDGNPELFTQRLREYQQNGSFDCELTNSIISAFMESRNAKFFSPIIENARSLGFFGSHEIISQVFDFLAKNPNIDFAISLIEETVETGVFQQIPTLFTTKSLIKIQDQSFYEECVDASFKVLINPDIYLGTKINSSHLITLILREAISNDYFDLIAKIISSSVCLSNPTLILNSDTIGSIIEQIQQNGDQYLEFAHTIFIPLSKYIQENKPEQSLMELYKNLKLLVQQSLPECTDLKTFEPNEFSTVYIVGNDSISDADLSEFANRLGLDSTLGVVVLGDLTNVTTEGIKLLKDALGNHDAILQLSLDLDPALVERVKLISSTGEIDNFPEDELIEFHNLLGNVE
ncbi:MAG: hypothetical protein COA94_08580 [Rickettsiales bacterium]|nr:MAG: hypothetical protein COA94_08580 [Rickettsiales bacterium]